MLAKIQTVTGPGVWVPGDDIDTDRIIPAKYLRCVTFDGLGKFAFYNERYTEDGYQKEHPLNDPRFAGAKVMLSGRNFGCGSSREHAPQSLKRSGIDVIIAENFAEIFFGNSLTLGLPCVTASKADITRLGEAVEANPALEISVDLAARTATAGDLSIEIDIPASAADALMNGQWDPIMELVNRADQVKTVHDNLSYTSWTNQ